MCQVWVSDLANTVSGNAKVNPILTFSAPCPDVNLGYTQT